MRTSNKAGTGVSFPTREREPRQLDRDFSCHPASLLWRSRNRAEVARRSSRGCCHRSCAVPFRLLLMARRVCFKPRRRRGLADRPGQQLPHRRSHNPVHRTSGCPSGSAACGSEAGHTWRAPATAAAGAFAPSRAELFAHQSCNLPYERAGGRPRRRFPRATVPKSSGTTAPCARRRVTASPALRSSTVARGCTHSGA